MEIDKVDTYFYEGPHQLHDMPYYIDTLILRRKSIGINFEDYCTSVTKIIIDTKYKCRKEKYRTKIWETDKKLIQDIGYAFYHYDCLICIKIYDEQNLSEPFDNQYYRPKNFYFLYEPTNELIEIGSGFIL